MHARCGSLGRPHLGQVTVRTGRIFIASALRRRVRERDIFLFGTAMTYPFGYDDPLPTGVQLRASRSICKQLSVLCLPSTLLAAGAYHAAISRTDH